MAVPGSGGSDLRWKRSCYTLVLLAQSCRFGRTWGDLEIVKCPRLVFMLPFLWHGEWGMLVDTSLSQILPGVVQWTLAYTNTLGPTPVHISEKFIYVKYHYIIVCHSIEHIYDLHICIVNVHVHELSIHVTWNTCTCIVMVECKISIKDDSVSCLKFSYLLLAAWSDPLEEQQWWCSGFILSLVPFQTLLQHISLKIHVVVVSSSWSSLSSISVSYSADGFITCWIISLSVKCWYPGLLESSFIQLVMSSSERLWSNSLASASTLCSWASVSSGCWSDSVALSLAESLFHDLVNVGAGISSRAAALMYTTFCIQWLIGLLDSAEAISEALTSCISSAVLSKPLGPYAVPVLLCLEASLRHCNLDVLEHCLESAMLVGFKSNAFSLMVRSDSWINL